MSAARRWISKLRPADLFSVPVVLGVSAEYVLVQVASPYNTSAGVALVLLQVVAVLLALGLLGALFLLLRCRLDDDGLRAVLLVCLPLAALLAGSALAWMRHAAGLDSEPMVLLRASTTLLHVTAMTVLLWLAVSGVRVHYAHLAELEREQDRLAELAAQVDRSLADLNREATEAVRDRILASLREEGESAEPADVLAVWRSTLEHTVRPLSRQLEAQSEAWVTPTSEARPPVRIDWRYAASEGMAPGRMSPVGLLVVLNVIAAAMNISRSGWVFAAEFVLLSVVVVLPAFVLLRLAAVRVAGAWHGVRRGAAFLVMCVLCGLALGAAMLPLTLGDPKPLRFVYLGPIFTALVAFVWGLAVAAQRQARETEDALQVVADELQWQVARSHERHRQRRQALAHALHGRVQATLAAAILELEARMRDGTVSSAWIDETQARIVSVVRDLDLHRVEPAPIAVIVSRTEATWQGVVLLDVRVDPEVEPVLARDAQCLMTLNDVIPELVFNSIKHGGAHRIEMSIDQIDDRTLALTASDDGVTAIAAGRSGLGSRLLDACAITWSRTRHEGRTTTHVVLPCASSAAVDEALSGALA